jgi:hypothetical protein
MTDLQPAGIANSPLPCLCLSFDPIHRIIVAKAVVESMYTRSGVDRFVLHTYNCESAAGLLAVTYT